MGEELIIQGRVTVGFIVSMLLAAMAVGLCLWMLFKAADGRDGSPRKTFWSSLVCLILALSWLVMQPLALAREAIVLRPDTFAQRGMSGGERTRRWDVVSDIKVVAKDNPEDAIFAWLYVPTVIQVRDPTEAPPGNTTCCIFTLSRPWGRSSEEIARTMNEWRAKSLARAARQ